MKNTSLVNSSAVHHVRNSISRGLKRMSSISNAMSSSYVIVYETIGRPRARSSPKNYVNSGQVAGLAAPPEAQIRMGTKSSRTKPAV